MNKCINWLFKRETQDEILRRNQRAMNRTVRELEREKTKLERQEQKLKYEIKKMAREGQIDAVKNMAKELVRIKAYINKFIMMKVNVQGIALKMTTLKANRDVAKALWQVSSTMATMNKQMNMPQLRQIMMNFEKQSTFMDMKQEIMEETMDDVMEGDDDAEEMDIIVRQVFDELGLPEELLQAPSVPQGTSLPASGAAVKGGGQPALATTSDGAEDDLQARLDQLRKI